MSSFPEILLIEDNADDRAMFVKAVAMSMLPARVTCAADAPQAVARLNRIGDFAGQPLPSLIILDLSLPGLQGRTLLQVIRNAFGPRLVPIVVLTGSLREEDRAECERWGISDYMVKPQSYFGLIEFVASLARYIPPAATQPDADAMTADGYAGGAD
ncbi:MAG: response regulator [Minicystis sp.]